MDHLIKAKIQDFESSTNKTEKIIRINQAIEFIIIYYAILFFFTTVAKRIVNRNVVEIILTNFENRNPTTSSWIKLLRASIDLLNLNSSNFKGSTSISIQEIANFFLPEESKKNINKSPDLKHILDSYQIIRNRGFAHSTAHSEDMVNYLTSKEFDKFPYELYDFLSSLSQVKLLLTENIPHFEDPSEYLNDFYFLDYSQDILKNVKIDLRNNDDYSNIFSNTLYCYCPSNCAIVPTSPFLIFKDRRIFYYNGIDDRQLPIFQDVNSSKIIVVKKYKEAFKELLKENLSLLHSFELSVKLEHENGVYHNLPAPIFNRFIGRDDSISRLLKALSNKRIFLLTISGIGGVGKSALALKLTREIIEKNPSSFSFIIWLSAKRTYLTNEGIKTEKQVFSNLLQLLDVILKITGFEEYLNFTYQAKKKSVLEILSMDKFLIIVDNFETVSSPEEFLNFFEEIGDKSDFTKMIITTRHQLGSSEKIIDLKEFSKNEYESFVTYLVNEKFKLNINIKQNSINDLYKITGGLALATEFFIGQVNKNNSIEKLIHKLQNQEITKESILEFSFKESFEILKYEEKKVLFTISLIEDPNLNKICFITGLDEFQVEEIIEKLKKLSFLNVNLTTDEYKYSILPLTKTFLQSNLDKDKFDKLKNELVTRLDEYKMITSLSEQISDGYTDLKLSGSKDSLAVRLAKAAHFLASQGNFTKSEEYFNLAVKYDNKNSMVWFNWAIAERDFSNNLKDEYFEKATSFGDDNEKLEIYYEWGKTLFSFNKPLQSIQKFEKFLELDSAANNPKLKNVHHYIGKSYYEIGKNLWKKGNLNEMKTNYNKSLKSFLNSLYENPNTHFEINHNVIGYYFIAKIYRYYNDIGHSITYVKKGLDLQPNNFRLIEFAEELENLSRKNKSSRL